MPDPEPPCYEPICIIDYRTEGVQNAEALRIAEYIVNTHNSALTLARRTLETQP